MSSKWLDALHSSSICNEDVSLIILDEIKNDRNRFDSVFINSLSALSEVDRLRLDTVLSEVVIKLFEKAFSAPNPDVDTFIHYHGYLQEVGRLRVRDYICSYLETKESQSPSPVKEMWYLFGDLDHIFLFENVSSDTFDNIFGPYGSWMSPVIRLWIFRWKKDDVVLLTDSVVEFWNYKAQSDKYYPFECYARHHRIVNYIKESPAAGDILLLIFYIETSNTRFFERIKDHSILFTWLPSADDKLIKKFILLSGKPDNVIPSDILLKTISILGFARIINLLDSEEKFDLSGFPKEVIIDLYVLIEKTSVFKTTESSGWHGGYWTWGEGMKHQQCTYYEYQVTKYNAIVNTSADGPIRDKLTMDKYKEIINDNIRRCLSNNISQSVFILSVCCKDYLAILSIGANDDSSTRLYQAFDQTWRALVDTETITD